MDNKLIESIIIDLKKKLPQIEKELENKIIIKNDKDKEIIDTSKKSIQAIKKALNDPGGISGILLTFMLIEMNNAQIRLIASQPSSNIIKGDLISIKGEKDG